MAETSSLLRNHTHTAYRGFESLRLRHFFFSFDKPPRPLPPLYRYTNEGRIAVQPKVGPKATENGKAALPSSIRGVADLCRAIGAYGKEQPFAIGHQNAGVHFVYLRSHYEISQPTLRNLGVDLVQ